MIREVGPFGQQIDKVFSVKKGAMHLMQPFFDNIVKVRRTFLGALQL